MPSSRVTGIIVKVSVDDHTAGDDRNELGMYTRCSKSKKKPAVRRSASIYTVIIVYLGFITAYKLVVSDDTRYKRGTLSTY